MWNPRESKSERDILIFRLRVFYDVSGGKVEVFAIVAKAHADAWLAEVGEPDEESLTEPPRRYRSFCGTIHVENPACR